MDKHRWNLTFQPRPTEDSALRLIQAVRLIVAHGLRASSLPQNARLVSDADEHPRRTDTVPKERSP